MVAVEALDPGWLLNLFFVLNAQNTAVWTALIWQLGMKTAF